MDTARAEEVFERFVQRSLPKSQWTHEAHVVVCWSSLQRMSPGVAMGFLREHIRAYNEATGVANTPTSGYHETITAFYVGTVASLDAPTAAAAVDAPECDRTSVLDHWTRTTLSSRAARANWRSPDLRPLSWDIGDVLDHHRTASPPGR